LFAIELIPGERIIIEAEADPWTLGKPVCRLSEISYLYRPLPGFISSRGISDDCEVNINCPEGDNWQYQKHGVVRIYVKQGGGYYWCTGAIMNNTLQNNDPLLLTADHCAPIASEEDLAQWIFYFNFEAPGCENPTENPDPVSMTGAVKLASAGTSGSDFLLIRLQEEIPLSYEPFFNGWSIENIASPNGVTIHHPAGDIKKVSTYTSPIATSQWYGTFGTHWEVYWSPTETNWGVTEQGSSGSPLFDNNGRVIGALTGGQADCEPNGAGSGTGPDQPDYYGKFSYSWDQNGSEPSQQLKYWLDPLNSGVSFLSGKNVSLTAAFQASTTLILTGNQIEYTNLSSGLPILWEWEFEGGIPSSYSGPDPGEILYPYGGYFDVLLIVSDGTDYDTLLLKDYIHVVGNVYPNPTTGVVNIYIEEELPSAIILNVYNNIGQKIITKEIPEQSYPLISVDLSGLSFGIYTIRIEVNQRYIFSRVILLEP
jgi:lysyl endopeptidase